MRPPLHVAGVVLALSVLFGSASAHAQSGRLVLPTTIAASAAAADWASTYYALTRAHVHEVNPVLRPLEHRPGRMVLLGGAIDLAGVWMWNRGVGSSRPTIAVSGLWMMGAFRGYLAVHNLRNAHRAPQRAREPAAVQAALTPTAPVDAPSSTTQSSQ